MLADICKHTCNKQQESIKFRQILPVGKLSNSITLRPDSTSYPFQFDITLVSIVFNCTHLRMQSDGANALFIVSWHQLRIWRIRFSAWFFERLYAVIRVECCWSFLNHNICHQGSLTCVNDTKSWWFVSFCFENQFKALTHAKDSKCSVCLSIGNFIRFEFKIFVVGGLLKFLIMFDTFETWALLIDYGNSIAYKYTNGHEHECFMIWLRWSQIFWCGCKFNS